MLAAPYLPELQVVAQQPLFSLRLHPPCAQDPSELTSLVHPGAFRLQRSLWGPQCWSWVLFLQGKGVSSRDRDLDLGGSMPTLTPTGCLA